jgi:hypothetical protein
MLIGSRTQAKTNRVPAQEFDCSSDILLYAEFMIEEGGGRTNSVIYCLLDLLYVAIAGSK